MCTGSGFNAYSVLEANRASDACIYELMEEDDGREDGKMLEVS